MALSQGRAGAFATIGVAALFLGVVWDVHPREYLVGWAVAVSLAHIVPILLAMQALRAPVGDGAKDGGRPREGQVGPPLRRGGGMESGQVFFWGFSVNFLHNLLFSIERFQFKLGWNCLIIIERLTNYRNYRIKVKTHKILKT